MKRYRFFGGLLTAQANWLNQMASRGLRLIRTEKLLYEFEPCAPGAYQYQVEFVGEKSRRSASDYAAFLREMGYRVFFKNINLNYSIGKVRYRPWAEKGGRLATNGTTFNRELLIVEKANDGKPFALHTTIEDRIAYSTRLRNPWLFLCLIATALAILQHTWVWAIFAAIGLIGTIACQAEISKLKTQSRIQE